MNTQTHLKIGNLLGAARAEVDSEMLERAFLETSDYRALKDTNQFNFIVGRRGTGKTALFLHLSKHLSENTKIFSHTLKPEEYDVLAFSNVFKRLGLEHYNLIRPAARVLWRTAMLMSVAESLCRYWKYRERTENRWLADYLEANASLLRRNELQRCKEMLDHTSAVGSTPEEIPGRIASDYQLSMLENEIRRGLESVGAKAVFLVDGLDEGWEPTDRSTAVLGGLAAAVADFGDRNILIQGKLFIRDNIFRLLAQADNDFSRHIEGSTLRLDWSQDSLLNLVVSRLRIVLDLATENNIRVWNRFAYRELKDRRGFQRCLQHTLYRPRDVLVLLNRAAVRAAREGRNEIVEDDIEDTSRQISLDRLNDLLKEYEGVFPGLSLVANTFSGAQAFQTTGSAKSTLDSLIAHETYGSTEASDVAVFGTGSQLLDALYSVGFVGQEDPSTGAFLFCHDGALSSISDAPEDKRIAIHPCYWKALDISEANTTREILVEINDDYEAKANREISDMRTRRLGQLVSDLPSCGEGNQGAAEFEEWVLRACRILFSGELDNIQLHPVPDGVQRRDIVASNNAERGFWKRILNDYKCRQVVFEVKNFPDLDITDFRQALAYTGNQYGQLAFIVYRVDSEKMDRRVPGWVKEMWDLKHVLIITLPTATLTRCLKKVRNLSRRSYIDEVLSRRLDTFERSYLSLRHPGQNRANKKQRK